MIFPFKPGRGDVYRTIFSLISLKGHATRQYLSDMTGLASTSLNRALDRLMTAGWIEESGLADSTGGRRPNLYCLSQDSKYLAVVYPEKAKVTLALTDLTLAVIAKASIPISEQQPDQDHSEAVLSADKLADTWSGLLFEANADLKNIAGLTIVESDNLKYPVSASIFISTLFGDNASEAGSPAASLQITLCRAYGALWQSDLEIDDSLVMVFADLEDTAFCIAAGGKRHRYELAAAPACQLLASASVSGKALILSKITSGAGLLKKYCRIKQEKNLSWDDFVKAVDENKKKAVQLQTELSSAISFVIFNTLSISGARHWLLEGTLNDALPGLANTIGQQLEAYGKKTGYEISQLRSFSSGPENLQNRVISGAAAYQIENLLSTLE